MAALVAKPAEFDFFPHNIYSDGTTDFDWDAQLPATFDGEYYMAPDGDDGNDGLTPETAVRTLIRASRLVNDPTRVHKINVAPGDYFESSINPSQGAYTSTYWVCSDPARARFHPAREDESSKFVADTRADVYIATGWPDTIYSMWDRGTLSSLGFWNLMFQVGSADEVESYAGEGGAWHLSSGNLYVKMPNGRAPDVDLRIHIQYRWNCIGYSPADDRKVWLEGMDFHMSLQNDVSNTTAACAILAHNCLIGYGSAQENALFTVSGGGAPNAHILLDSCVTPMGYKDGSSAGSEGKVIVLNSYQMGFRNESGSNNATTLHGNSMAVRVGSVFQNGMGAVYIDIDNSHSFAVGCFVADGAEDIDCSHSGSQMHLINMRTIGSFSTSGVIGGGTIYTQNNQWETGPLPGLTEIPYSGYTPDNSPPVVEFCPFVKLEAGKQITVTPKIVSPDGLPVAITYNQIGGDTATIVQRGENGANDSTGQIFEITMPAQGSGDDFVMEVTATDANGSTTNTMSYQVMNTQLPVGPSANAGTDTNVSAGASFALDSSASTAGDAAIVSRTWTQTSGSEQLTIANPNAAITSATAPLISGPEAYTFRVTLTDENGQNSFAEVVYTVRDTTAPVITRVGDSVVQVNVGFPPELEGFIALDNVDGDITNNIVVTGNPDFNTIGTYTRTANVSDAAGNAATPVSYTYNVTSAVYPFSIRNGSNFAHKGQDGRWTETLRAGTTDSYSITLDAAWVAPESIVSYSLTPGPQSQDLTIVSHERDENQIVLYVTCPNPGDKRIRVDWATPTRTDYCNVTLVVQA